jgi:dTDP-4-amino-4,6-dideoxygalactose transaminase
MQDIATDLEGTDCPMGFSADSAGWPVWPQPSPNVVTLLTSVVRSSRWSISTYETGTMSYEREFARRFAALHGVAHCIPTANGTSALICALASLDVGAYDEVIIPGLTWVALVAAPLAVNAIPVPVDIDECTLCISPAAVEAAITPRTRAIIAVHLYCSVAAIVELTAVAARHNIPLIEDCAQSHASSIGGRLVGTFGRIGVFSFHQGKPLAAGEGGCAITNDPNVAAAIEQLRASGRQTPFEAPPIGCFALRETGRRFGSNMALSEFGAAVALGSLEALEAQLQREERAATFLRSELSRVPGLYFPERPPNLTRQTYYHFVVRFDREMFRGTTADALAAFLTECLGCHWQRTYVPLNRHPLAKAATDRRFALGSGFQNSIDLCRHSIPQCEAVHETSVIVHHRVLLANRRMLVRIPEAFDAFRNAR